MAKRRSVEDPLPELTEEEMLHAYRMLRQLKAGLYTRLGIEMHRRDRVLIITGIRRDRVKCGPGAAIIQEGK